jgi:hypothetical protein
MVDGRSLVPTHCQDRAPLPSPASSSVTLPTGGGEFACFRSVTGFTIHIAHCVYWASQAPSDPPRAGTPASRSLPTYPPWAVDRPPLTAHTAVRIPQCASRMPHRAPRACSISGGNGFHKMRSHRLSANCPALNVGPLRLQPGVAPAKRRLAFCPPPRPLPPRSFWRERNQCQQWGEGFVELGDGGAQLPRPLRTSPPSPDNQYAGRNNRGRLGEGAKGWGFMDATLSIGEGPCYGAGPSEG